MIAYVDSSVVLRIVLGEGNPIALWPPSEELISSTLLNVECVRSIDRVRVIRALPLDTIRMYRVAVAEIIELLDLISITHEIIGRASQALPFPIRTLDAIHLATALEWRERNRKDIAFATHDRNLATAARAVGFEVIGA